MDKEDIVGPVLRFTLPMQDAWIQSLVRKLDPTCCQVMSSHAPTIDRSNMLQVRPRKAK